MSPPLTPPPCLSRGPARHALGCWGAASLVSAAAPSTIPRRWTLQASTAPVPATAIAVPQPQAASNSGGLFQANRYRPPFESRRARLVGDMVTIQIAEKVTGQPKVIIHRQPRQRSMAASIDKLPLLTGGALGTANKLLRLGAGSEHRL